MRATQSRPNRYARRHHDRHLFGTKDMAEDGLITVRGMRASARRSITTIAEPA
jgi:hypothetical protein